jgi:hypothetical protein
METSFRTRRIGAGDCSEGVGSSVLSSASDEFATNVREERAPLLLERGFWRVLSTMQAVVSGFAAQGEVVVKVHWNVVDG